ncbi:MAG: hypothetical protein R3E95_15500 [Thiolinea sp.]
MMDQGVKRKLQHTSLLLLMMAGAHAVMADEQGLHPFMTMGGPVNKAGLQQAGLAEGEVAPQAQDGALALSPLRDSDSFTQVNERERAAREYALSEEQSALANSDSFTQTGRADEQVQEHQFSFLNLLGVAPADKSMPVPATQQQQAMPQAKNSLEAPVAVINPGSSGGLSQSDSFTRSNRADEQVREHSFNLF